MNTISQQGEGHAVETRTRNDQQRWESLLKASGVEPGSNTRSYLEKVRALFGTPNTWAADPEEAQADSFHSYHPWWQRTKQTYVGDLVLHLLSDFARMPIRVFAPVRRTDLTQNQYIFMQTVYEGVRLVPIANHMIPPVIQKWHHHWSTEVRMLRCVSVWCTYSLVSQVVQRGIAFVMRKGMLLTPEGLEDFANNVAKIAAMFENTLSVGVLRTIMQQRNVDEVRMLYFASRARILNTLFVDKTNPQSWQAPASRCASERSVPQRLRPAW